MLIIICKVIWLIPHLNGISSVPLKGYLHILSHSMSSLCCGQQILEQCQNCWGRICQCTLITAWKQKFQRGTLIPAHCQSIWALLLLTGGSALQGVSGMFLKNFLACRIDNLHLENVLLNQLSKLHPPFYFLCSWMLKWCCSTRSLPRGNWTSRLAASRS